MVVITGSSKKKLSTEEAYEIHAGTWINEGDNPDQSYVWPAKIIIKPDGTYEAHYEVNSKTLPTTGKITIIDCMVDSDDNIWMKVNNDWNKSNRKATLYQIVKISSSKTTMEVFASEKEGWYGKDYPTDLKPQDTLHINYYILYRQ